jgi:hypothetical protein
MLPDREFWTELDRLLLKEDVSAAAALVNDQLESFHDILKEKFEEAQNKVIH